MAIKVSELNKDDIYYRSYPSGTTGKCKFIGTRIYRPPGRNNQAITNYRFRFLKNNSVISTTARILEHTNIYNRVKVMKKAYSHNPKVPSSW